MTLAMSYGDGILTFVEVAEIQALARDMSEKRVFGHKFLAGKFGGFMESA